MREIETAINLEAKTEEELDAKILGLCQNNVVRSIGNVRKWDGGCVVTCHIQHNPYFDRILTFNDLYFDVRGRNLETTFHAELQERLASLLIYTLQRNNGVTFNNNNQFGFERGNEMVCYKVYSQTLTGRLTELQRDRYIPIIFPYDVDVNKIVKNLKTFAQLLDENPKQYTADELLNVCYYIDHERETHETNKITREFLELIVEELKESVQACSLPFYDDEEEIKICVDKLCLLYEIPIA